MSLDTIDEPEPTTETPTRGATTPPKHTVSLRISTLATAGAGLAALVVIGVLATLLISARSDISHHDTAARDTAHAEQFATNYALGASTIDYKDANAWFTKLKAGTTPELAAKFDATAPQLQAILTPLQWTSTAQPVTAKVMSDNNGIYKVNVFLNVTSTSAQTPQSAQTTVTYYITLDRANGWKITDVGGMDGALPIK